MNLKKRQSGQILILVLLVVIVALAVSLSVAGRNLTNLRTATQTEQSQRSFTAAEGGVEDVLSRLSTIVTDPAVISAGGKDIAVTIGPNVTTNVNVKASSQYESKVGLGEIGQIDLSGATGTSIQVEWAKASDPLEANEPASVELTVVKLVAGVYSQTRTFWVGGIFASRDETCLAASGCNPNCVPSADFRKCTRISLESGARILRIKPFWVSTTARVTSVSGSLPTQFYTLTSTATTDIGVTRKVEVTRTRLPSLPVVFDYVLYSNGDIVK